MVDVVFTGGRVVDVRTCTSRIANVAVEHGKIVDISAHELPAKRVVDAAGLVVARALSMCTAIWTAMPMRGSSPPCRALPPLSAATAGFPRWT
ncbi:MAG: hypothetical protein ACLR7U_12855 [Ruthenibacterium lactatiformans]